MSKERTTVAIMGIGYGAIAMQGIGEIPIGPNTKQIRVVPAPKFLGGSLYS